jgi:hypothetical protein
MKAATLMELRAMIIQLCSENEKDMRCHIIANISAQLKKLLNKMEAILNMHYHEKPFQGLKKQDRYTL